MKQVKVGTVATFFFRLPSEVAASPGTVLVQVEGPDHTQYVTDGVAIQSSVVPDYWYYAKAIALDDDLGLYLAQAEGATDKDEAMIEVVDQLASEAASVDDIINALDAYGVATPGDIAEAFATAEPATAGDVTAALETYDPPTQSELESLVDALLAAIATRQASGPVALQADQEVDVAKVGGIAVAGPDDLKADVSALGAIASGVTAANASLDSEEFGLAVLLAAIQIVAGADGLAKFPGQYAAGTIGNLIGRIGSGQFTVVQLLDADGNLTLYAGADYTTDTIPLDFEVGQAQWPADLTDWTIRLYTDYFTANGAVLVATGTGRKVRVELAKAAHAMLPAQPAEYVLWATSPGGVDFPLGRGKITKRRRPGS